MTAVDTLAPVCVDVAREAPETLPVAAPLSGVPVTPTPAVASKSGAASVTLHREERWTFGVIAVFAAMLIAVAMQPTSARPATPRNDARYAAMDGGASLLAGARVALARSVR